MDKEHPIYQLIKDYQNSPEMTIPKGTRIRIDDFAEYSAVCIDPIFPDGHESDPQIRINGYFMVFVDGDDFSAHTIELVRADGQ